MGEGKDDVAAEGTGVESPKGGSQPSARCGGAGSDLLRDGDEYGVEDEDEAPTLHHTTPWPLTRRRREKDEEQLSLQRLLLDHKRLCHIDGALREPEQGGRSRPVPALLMQSGAGGPAERGEGRQGSGPSGGRRAADLKPLEVRLRQLSSPPSAGQDEKGVSCVA